MFNLSCVSTTYGGQCNLIQGSFDSFFQPSSSLIKLFQINNIAHQEIRVQVINISEKIKLTHFMRKPEFFYIFRGYQKDTSCMARDMLLFCFVLFVCFLFCLCVCLLANR